MNKLFICSTVYQLIVALQIKKSIYNKCDADIILTDEIKNLDSISARMRDLGVFKNVIVVKGKGTQVESGRMVYFPNLFAKKVRDNIVNLEVDIFEKERYDKIFFSNIGGQNYRLAKLFSRRNNKAVVCMYEDGISTYTRIFGDTFAELKLTNLKAYLVYALLNRIEEIYIFNPDIFMWEPKCKLKKIPSVLETRKELCEILNHIFKYEEIKDSYSEKVIFFEESYVADGDEIDDISIVRMLEEKYGKEQIFVKSHPRNPTNRFEEMGYKTNVDKVIPWEVIAMNISLENKVLASVSSTAVVSTFLLLNAKSTLILEYEQINSSNDRLKKTIEVINLLKKTYPSVFKNLKD